MRFLVQISSQMIDEAHVHVLVGLHLDYVVGGLDDAGGGDAKHLQQLGGGTCKLNSRR